MRYLVPLAVAFWSSGAAAAPIDALSFLQVEYGYVVNGGAGAPAGIVARTQGPVMGRAADSGIDDAGAVVAIDDLNVTIGCSSCDPPVPFVETRRHRVNRADPTEFADAQYGIEATSIQDPAATSFAIGEREEVRSGLAQARITSSPVAAFADSAYSLGRTTSFENESGQTIAFNIQGYFDADLLARYSGDDGFARTSTTFDLLFDGVSADALVYLPLDTYILDIDEAAAGAEVSESLVANQPGTIGLSFSAAASALGDGGFTEATVTAMHAFLFRLTLAPGETAFMTASLGQTNAVEYTPSTAPVPLPASGVLFAGALACVAMGCRRAGRRAL